MVNLTDIVAPRTLYPFNVGSYNSRITNNQVHHGVVVNANDRFKAAPERTFSRSTTPK
jgi:hypothetical protein